MSGWHRQHPELVGTDSDPWMRHADYRRFVPVPESEREAVCICRGSEPDENGNRDQIVNPACPVCA